MSQHVAIDDHSESDAGLEVFCDVPEYAPPNTTTRPRRQSLATQSVLVPCILANVVLLLGYSFNLWFEYYEFNRRDRETVAIVVYFVAFSLLILSGIMELCVDAFSVRTSGHGRYHADSANWNVAISILFVSAGLLDVVAFIFWMKMMKGEENAVLLISAYVLFLTAIFALLFDILKLKKESWPRMTRPDRIDLMANGLFFVTALIGIVLRHVQFAEMGFAKATNEMELVMVPLFLFCSILYVSADGHRWNTKVD